MIQETGGVCAFCEGRDVATLQFHHIAGRDISDPHNPENLIYVCGNCHAKITAGEISEADVRTRKRFWQWIAEKQNRTTPKAIVHGVAIINESNTGPITNNFNFRSGKQKPKLPPPTGVIATDANCRNYIKHLIDRYNDFASEKGTIPGFRYPAIYGAIKGRFKTTWDMVPLVHFEKLAAYLHGRINDTRLGCINRGKGQPNYSPFSKYVSEHGIPAS
ncbi:MAG TPA: HNH endonuclease signature motif containing protein [Chthoniobacterales bacterium]|nr:HNH endonuclease signature motif containing protein [Chthoniobacterales bacterium]